MLTNEERIEKKMAYIHKIAAARHISYQEAYKLAVVKNYLEYVDNITELTADRR